MRYIPQTDDAVRNERKQAEASWATKVNEAPAAAAAPVKQKRHAGPDWAELQRLALATSRITGRLNHAWFNCCAISHSMTVAKAMGNWPEYRRLRAQLIAGLW